MRDVTGVCAKQVFNATVIFLTMAIIASGSGFRNPPEDAQAMGRPAGKIAVVENATAVDLTRMGRLIVFVEGPTGGTGTVYFDNLKLIGPVTSLKQWELY